MRHVLCAILRSYPESVIPCWDLIVDFMMHAASDDTKQQEISVDLLEALLQGRKDFPSDKMHGMSWKVSAHFFDVAFFLRHNVNVKVRHGLLRSYTALMSEDWSFLEKDPKLFSEHVEVLLVGCVDNNADIRRASCKAIGEFCALYLDSTRLSQDKETSSIIALVNRICTIMSERLNLERDASTLAMVIHALGNLALALVENDGLGVLEDGSTVQVATKILLVINNDSNDKVVGNAIRSIGHFGSILMFFGKHQLVVDIVNALSFRIARTVAVASHEEQAMMTWKERSSAKKHGWGACHALGRIFHAVTDEEEPSLTDALRRGIEQLSQCVIRARTLSEKVVLAAMAAWRELKPPCLVSVVGNTGLLGEALSGVCILVFRDHSNPKFVQQGDPLLSHLLMYASVADAATVLRHDEASPFLLDSLYMWMVDHDMEGRAFEMFALALAGRNDVSLEQRFASRALMQYKKGYATMMESNEGKDEGEDEL